MPAGGDQVNVADIAAAQAGGNLRPCCRLLQVGSGQSIPNNANTALTWDTEDYDYGGLHAAGSANCVITRAGVWRAKASILLPARSDYTTYGMCIAKNGTNLPTFERWQPGTASAQRSCTVITSNLYAVGDTVSAIAFQTNTAAVAVTTAFGSSFESSMELEFVRDA